MPLTPLPKKLSRPLTLTIRISEQAKHNLETLVSLNNRSQADVIEVLLEEEVLRAKGGTVIAEAVQEEKASRGRGPKKRA